MNSEERDVINGIFQRLEQASSQPRDADAERFIADKLRNQPYAPYAMAQLIYVQEEAIKSLNQQLEEARQMLQAQPQGGGGFLSSIFGGGARPEPPRQGQWGNQPGYGNPPPGYGPQSGYGQQGGYGPQGGFGGPQGGYPPQGGPWGAQAQQQPARGGGFLATALPMAAGAAGGMLLGSALSNAFAGGHSQLGSSAAAGLGNLDNGNQDLGAALGGGSAGGVQDAGFGSDPGLGGGFDGDPGDGDDDWV